MRFDTRRITPFSRAAITLDRSAQEGFLQLVVCAQGSNVSTPPGVTGIWWPLYGSVQALSGEFRANASRRECLINDHQRSFDLSVRSSSRAIGIVGTTRAWSALLSQVVPHGTLDPALFPALHAAPLSTRRKLFGLLRVLLDRRQGTLSAAERHALADIARDLQREFEPLIARSPGQNMPRRRAAFLRLQRIRNLIFSATQRQFDVRAMASSANYSVWHFIRIYDAVFGETPYAHLSRCRVERAKRLLSDGDRCVGDVALAVGYDNRAALTRAVKKQIGTVPSRLLGAAHEDESPAEIVA